MYSSVNTLYRNNISKIKKNDQNFNYFSLQTQKKLVYRKNDLPVKPMVYCNTEKPNKNKTSKKININKTTNNYNTYNSNNNNNINKDQFFINYTFSSMKNKHLHINKYSKYSKLTLNKFHKKHHSVGTKKNGLTIINDYEPIIRGRTINSNNNYFHRWGEGTLCLTKENSLFINKPSKSINDQLTSFKEIDLNKEKKNQMENGNNIITVNEENNENDKEISNKIINNNNEGNKDNINYYNSAQNDKRRLKLTIKNFDDLIGLDPLKYKDISDVNKKEKINIMGEEGSSTFRDFGILLSNREKFTKIDEEVNNIIKDENLYMNINNKNLISKSPYTIKKRIFLLKSAKKIIKGSQKKDMLIFNGINNANNIEGQQEKCLSKKSSNLSNQDFSFYSSKYITYKRPEVVGRIPKPKLKVPKYSDIYQSNWDEDN